MARAMEERASDHLALGRISVSVWARNDGWTPISLMVRGLASHLVAGVRFMGPGLGSVMRFSAPHFLHII